MKLLATTVLAVTFGIVFSQAPAGGARTPSEFDKDFKLASGAFAKHDLTEAKRLFELCMADAVARADVDAQATALTSLGKVARSAGDMRLAVDDDQKALALQEKLGNSADIARAFDNVGVDFFFVGRPDKALESFEKGLELRQKIGNLPDTAQSLNEVGAAYNALGQFDKALPYFQQSLAMREQIGDPQGIARSLSNVGSDCWSLGRLDEAVDYQRKALAMFEKTGSNQDIAQCLNGVGSDYFSLGEFDKALDFQKRSMAIRVKLGDRSGIGESWGNLGSTYAMLGHFDEALQCHEKALEIRDLLPNPVDDAISLHNVAADYNALGQDAKALTFEQKALALQERIGNPASIATSHISVAACYNSLGEFDKALAEDNLALSQREKVRDPAVVAIALHNTAGDYVSLGRYDKALELYQESLALKEKIGNPASIAQGLNDIGATSWRLGQFDNALEYHQKALVMREALGNRASIADSLGGLGESYTSLGRYVEAAGAYSRALKLYEELRGQVGDPSELGSLQTSQHGDIYARFAAVRLRQGRVPEAIALVDAGRAQGLSRQIALEDLKLETVLSPDDAKGLRELHGQFLAAAAKLRNLDEQAGRAQGDVKTGILTQAEAAKAATSDAEMKYGLKRDALFSKYPSFKQIAGEESASGPQIVRLGRTHPDTLFLEYALGANKAMAFIVSGAKGLKAVEITLNAQQLAKDVKSYLGAIASDPKEERRLARQLYSQILGPVKIGFKNRSIKRLCIVGDGPLLDLPFAALIDGSGKRLVERYAVSTAVSLGSMLWHGTSRRPSRSVLVVADPNGAQSAMVQNFGPLPGARAEGQVIAKEIRGATALYGPTATVSTVSKEMPRYALLHFACHGYLDSSQAMRSALVMAGDSQGGGFLAADDIMNLRLSAQLAVLSACETGEGIQSGGEGLMGLTWAFRGAGVPAVVASKWQVDDKSTARMMVRFYKELLAGARKDDALRAAMLQEMKLEESGTATRSLPMSGPVGGRSSMYYWAAFQVIGDCSRLKPLPK